MPPRPRSVRLAAVALCAVLAGAVTGCGADLFGTDPQTLPTPSLTASPVDPPDRRTTTGAPGEHLGRFYEQEVHWQPCRSGNLCTKVEVPLDYADPDGRTIELSVLKVPARSQDGRVGSLLVNPGGPGASGVEYAAQASSFFGAELLHAFDIVGFDPRGVGQSSPVDCVSDRELDAFVASDPDPDTAAERAEADRLLAELAQGCLDNSGDLARHVSTEEAARDMDILRAVLGDRSLSYFGASYGTYLGATYAELFPERVGRMVLDGAIDPSVSTKEMSLVQAKGFETALRAYVDSCVRAGDCFLGDTVDAGTERIRDFLAALDADPLPGVDDRQLTVGTAVYGIWWPLYNEASWPVLTSALEAGFGGDGAMLLRLADGYTSRGSDGYTNNAIEALYAVNCLDHPDAVPVAQVPAHVPEFLEVSPTFGRIFAYSLSSCAHWPGDAGNRPAPIRAEGAAPILVIGTSRDPATPLEWARALADQLDSGVLVSRDGDGHTGYNAGNPCVDEVVESYLVSGTVPESDVAC